MIILDEPTAALGVAQTAEVLNLIERLREQGLGVIMISHNMTDIQAVADVVVVLRLGRNNGVFDIGAVSTEDIVAAITGATDNVVARRAAVAAERLSPADERSRHADRRRRGTAVIETPADTAANGETAAAAIQDQLLNRPAGVGGAVRGFIDRVRGGDLGLLPVIAGLIVISHGAADLQLDLPVEPQSRQPRDGGGARRGDGPRASCACCSSARSTCRSVP